MTGTNNVQHIHLGPVRDGDRSLATMSGISGIYHPENTAMFSKETAWGLLAAAVCGALMMLAMPPWGFWPLAFVSLVLLDFLMDGCQPKLRFARGLFFGAGWLLPSLIWMWDFSPVGYVAAVAGFALFYAVGLLACPADARLRWWVLPVIVVLVGYLRWRWPFGGVPLSTIAMSQAGSPLLRTGSIFGPLFIVWLVAMVSVSLAALLRRQWLLALVGPVILGLAWGLAPLAPTARQVGELNVALVQGGGEQRTRAAETDFSAVFGRHIQASEELVRQPVDLVIWPENVIDVETFANSDEARQLVNLAETLGAPLVVGAIEDDGPGKFNNFSAVITPPRSGTAGAITDRYDKVRRVPFGEYVPLRWLIEPFAPDYLPERDASSGQGPAVLEVELPPGSRANANANPSAAAGASPDPNASSAAGASSHTIKLGIAISWEIFFEDRGRDAIANGGQVIVNPTNGSSYWLTIVQSQQVAASRLRAVEADRYVLQVAPTGFTAVVSPNGVVQQRSAISEARVIHATVELREGQTLAIRYGVWPTLGLASLGLALALVQLSEQRYGLLRRKGLDWFSKNRRRARRERRQIRQQKGRRSKQRRLGLGSRRQRLYQPSRAEKRGRQPSYKPSRRISRRQRRKMTGY